MTELLLRNRLIRTRKMNKILKEILYAVILFFATFFGYKGIREIVLYLNSKANDETVNYVFWIIVGVIGIILIVGATIYEQRKK